MNKNTTDNLVSRMRELEADHAPEGWPAVQMKEISALCEIIERMATLLDNMGCPTDFYDWESSFGCEACHDGVYAKDCWIAYYCEQSV